MLSDSARTNAVPFLAHIEKLYALAVVRETGSLRGAASRLGIAPSSLSERLGVLEGLYRRALLERGREGLSVTPFARELLEQAARPLEEMLALAPQASKGKPERIRIGAYDSLAVHVLPRLLDELPDGSAPLLFDVTTGRSALLLAALSRGEIDFAVAVADETSAQVEAKRVAQETLCFVHHRTESEAGARASILAGTYVGLAPRRGYPDYYREFIRAHGAPSVPFLTCDSFEVALSLAETLRVPALLPARVASRSSTLRVLSSPKDVAQASAHDIVLARRRSFRSPIFAVLQRRLSEALAM
ncbi:MAG: LysR family transcriptional regulator [Polyangiaceae bacterium]